MVVAALALRRVPNGLDDAVGYAHAHDTQGVPQTSVENHMTGVPDPFKTERQHIDSSFLRGTHINSGRFSLYRAAPLSGGRFGLG
jgi:hypothetical protein